MNTLKLEMENCYGIQKIQQDIDFLKIMWQLFMLQTER